MSIKCQHCGIECEKTGTRQRFCSACARLAELRRGELRRRLAGYKEAGPQLICIDCRRSCVRTGLGQKRCSQCALAKIKETDAIHDLRRRRSRGVRAVGSHIICERCSTECPMTNGSQKYCSGCSEIRSKEVNTSEKVRRRRREWTRNYRQSDPKRILNARMSTALRRGLSKGKMGRSWTSLLGYGANELKLHLEHLFKDGMDWGNIHLWEIDHIKPIAHFKFESANDQAFLECWQLANLQPLWMVDNRRKGAFMAEAGVPT